MRGIETLALTAMLFAAPAAAQTAAASATTEGGGDDIVVTAQKREQRLQDVPISIVVKSGDLLKDDGINDYFALQARIPNLVIVDTPANKSITIRGIGTSGNSYSFEQSVALFVDGIYGGRNRQFNQPFLDVQRVEVLRGPQGALFGRNTSAGAISVVSARPGDKLGGEVSGEYEFVRDSRNLTGIVNVPLGDTLAVRVAGRYARVNGFIDNTTLGRDEPVRDDYLVRGSVQWKPAPDVTVFGKLEYTKSKIKGSAFEFAAFGSLPDYRKDTDDAFSPERDNSNTLNGVLQADIGIGTHTLTALTGYSHYRYDQAFNIQGKRPARLVVDNGERFKQWSQEVRLASPTGGRLDYVVGAYVEHGESNVRRVSIIDVPPPPSPDTQTSRTFDQKTDVVAVFAQANVRLIDQVMLSGGLRYTHIKKHGYLTGSTLLFPATVIPRAPLAGDIREDDVSPSATLTWTPSRDLNVYARYARGDKGGAFSEFQNVTAANFILRPEKSDAFEIGSKVQIPSIRGFVNLAAFTTDYQDLQKSALDINTASFVTSNAAGARTRGVEIEGGFEPLAGLRFNAGIAYLDAKYTSFPNGPCRFDNPSVRVAGCTQNRKGDRLQSSPEWSGNAALAYDAPISAALRLIASATVNFQSDINYQETENPLEVQPAFAKTDLRIGLGGVKTAWEVTLLVRNVFDKRTSGLIFETFPVGVAPNDRVYAPDPKRTFTLQARLRF